MKNQSTPQNTYDEAAKQTSYRMAYVVMSFGLLAVIAYRGFFLKQNSWELFAVILAGGLTAALYQRSKQTINPGISVEIAAAGIGAAILAFILMLFLG